MNRKTGMKRTFFFAVTVVLIVLMLGCSCNCNQMLRNRIIKDFKNEITEELSKYRNGEKNDLEFSFGAAAVEDQDFKDFLVTQASEMIENNETGLLFTYLKILERKKVYISDIQDLITNVYEHSETLEDAMKLNRMFGSFEYYNEGVKPLNRHSGILASYIETNGINPITDVPGTGYYADREDYYHKDVIGKTEYEEMTGLSGSSLPLYDVVEDRYCGDFWLHSTYGVKLNQYYEETRYSTSTWRFRDVIMEFAPKEGECVYSGDYLFSFAENGDLIKYQKIN